jgi:pyrroline-5-carboxylate reductase
VKDNKLVFIGAGNMASSLIGGLITRGTPPANIIACDPSEDCRAGITAQFQIATSANNTSVTEGDIVVLAVKPQIMKTVAESLAPHLHHKPLIISIAAGINLTSLQEWLGNDLPIIRCMPNTPALVQRGATAFYCNTHTHAEHKALATELLNAVGIAQELDNEAQLDAVTALSGSGPAYFFLLIEAMQETGSNLGLSKEVASALARQTALGAAEMATTSNVSIVELRQQVTSPGGTTEQALKIFNDYNFKQIVQTAMQAAAKRSQELSDEFGK